MSNGHPRNDTPVDVHSTADGRYTLCGQRCDGDSTLSAVPLDSPASLVTCKSCRLELRIVKQQPWYYETARGIGMVLMVFAIAMRFAGANDSAVWFALLAAFFLLLALNFKRG